MRIFLIILLSFFLLSTTSDKVPRKYRGVYQGTLTPYTISGKEQAIQITGAVLRITIEKNNISVDLEGKTFSAIPVLKAVTKEYSTYTLELGAPLGKASLRIAKKGKKLEWICDGFEKTILVQ